MLWRFVHGLSWLEITRDVWLVANTRRHLSMGLFVVVIVSAQHATQQTTFLNTCICFTNGKKFFVVGRLARNAVG